MKVSMTNSNRGLGLELSKRFKDVVEGFDNTSDIFINNRHNSFNQTKLLMKAFEEWKDSEKTIVNIVSRSKYPNISKGYMYSASKAALSHLSNNLRLLSDKKCRIIDINPGGFGAVPALDEGPKSHGHCKEYEQNGHQSGRKQGFLEKFKHMKPFFGLQNYGVLATLWKRMYDKKLNKIVNY